MRSNKTATLGAWPSYVPGLVRTNGVSMDTLSLVIPLKIGGQRGWIG